MNNVWTAFLRTPCVGLRTPLIRPRSQFLPTPFATQPLSNRAVRRRLLSSTTAKAAKAKPKPKPHKSVSNTKDRHHVPPKPNTHGTPSHHHPSSRTPQPRSRPTPPPPKPSYPWGTPLSPQAITSILGANVTRADGNALLAELHSRRVSGSLSEHGVSFAEDVDVSPAQAMAGLHWLRREYGMDEAGAARGYAQRRLEELQGEEGEGESEGAQMGESLHGRSVVQEAAQQFQAERVRKEKVREEEAEVRSAKVLKNTEERRLSIGQQFVELDVQREEKYKYWDELKKAAELPAEKVVEERSAFSRLFKPTLFSLSILLAAALLSDPNSVVPPQGLTPQSWKLPSVADITPSMTTCAAITVVNLALYVAWRNPRLWRTMNRNFLLSAGVPQPASMLGAVFSHQFWLSHLLGNTLLLFVVGMPLHDEIGRLNFLALYLGVGVAGSLASLYWNVLRRNLLVATLGASGATSGLVGAYFAVSPRRDLYVPFTNVVVPYDSWLAIVGFLVLEGFTMWRSGGKLFDHPAHLGGLAAGVVAGWALRLGSPKADVELEGHAPRGAETRLDGGES